MSLKTVSLFTGAGGLDIGFLKEGYEVLVANEYDKHAAETYRINHPSTKMIEGDIEEKIPEIVDFVSGENIDLVLGGPSCQGFSVAGKMDHNDPRNKMVWKFFEVVELIKPRMFVMENVKALASLEKWQPIRKEIFSLCNDLGYSVTPVLLNSKDFGVPQKRERVFFIGIRNDSFSENLLFELFSEEKEEEVTVIDAIRKFGPAGSKDNPLNATAKISLAARPIIRKSPYAGMLFNGAGRPINVFSQSNTLPASMGGNRTPIIDEAVLYGNEKSGFVEDYHKLLIANEIEDKSKIQLPSSLRRLTITEAAAIQTFPENYIFSGPMSAIYRQIGNAVPCNLSSAVARVVKRIFENDIRCHSTNN